MKKLRNQIKEKCSFKRGDIVRLTKPLFGFPVGGYFRVEDTTPPLLSLSVGSVYSGVQISSASHFTLANGEHPDWQHEEVFFQRHYCKFLESIGQPCPHCEENLRKSEAALADRLLQ